MTDQELKDLVARLAQAQEKTDAQLRLNAQQQAKSDEKLDKLGKLYGGISANMGAHAEEFFYNSLEHAPTVGGVSYDEIFAKVYGGQRGKQTEYDLVLVNGNAVALIEVKYKVHPDHIEQVEKQLKQYRDHFPEHKDFKLYGGIAGFSIPDEVIEQAHQRGLFILKAKGDVIEQDTQAMRAF